MTIDGSCLFGGGCYIKHFKSGDVITSPPVCSRAHINRRRSSHVTHQLLRHHGSQKSVPLLASGELSVQRSSYRTQRLQIISFSKDLDISFKTVCYSVFGGSLTLSHSKYKYLGSDAFYVTNNPKIRVI